MASPVKRKVRMIKTVKPIAVLDIDELDAILTTITMLINKDKETDQTKVKINFNAKKVQADLKKYRRSLTEYYKIEA